MRFSHWGALVSAVALVAGLACSKPAKVTLAPQQVLFNDSGASKALQAAVFDAKDRPMEKAKVTFASSSPEVAEVDASGKVTVRNSGETVITATSGKAMGTANIVVHLVMGLKLELPTGGAKGPQGTQVPLVVIGTNEKGDPADLAGISFTSSNPEIASVDGEGKMTLLASGNTTLEATIGKSKAKLPAEVHVLVPVAIKVPTPAVQTIHVGETVLLDATVLSDLGEPMRAPFTCALSSDKVASVDANGMVTGLARGTVEVAITAGTAKNTLKVVVR
jgi:uncharacterized protein YjdB